MSDNNFLIFGISRCGGSTLEHSIRAGINQGKTGGEIITAKDEYRDRINSHEEIGKKKEELFLILDELHKDGDYIGIKTNTRNFWFSNKWVELTNYLFDYYDKIILNFRVNILKTCVSHVIAAKTGNWEVHNEEERHKVVENEETWTVDIERLKLDAKMRRKLWNLHVEYIESSDTPYYSMNYKRLYGIDDLEYRISEIKKVINWLGYDYDDENEDEIRSLLHPEHKSNDKRTYQLIENIDEINEELGPDFGYLY